MTNNYKFTNLERIKIRPDVLSSMKNYYFFFYVYHHEFDEADFPG